MSPKLEKKLFTRFKKFFAQRGLPMTQTAMCWGIDCGDGWFRIIWDACVKIEKEISSNLIVPDFQFVQIKEKFGGLRLYSNGTISAIYTIMYRAERKSVKTCELCGKPGKISNDGWSRCRCNKCKDS